MAIISWAEQVGIAFDMFLNAILGGKAGQTISIRAALASQSGSRLGCLFCRLLSWLVQRNHCADQLAGIGMPFGSYVRALICLIALAWLMATTILAVIRWA
jgi:hypothetical protein